LPRCADKEHPAANVSGDRHAKPIGCEETWEGISVGIVRAAALVGKWRRERRGGMVTWGFPELPGYSPD
jgi:hypothetical protein